MKYSQNDGAGETFPTNRKDFLSENETDEKSSESEENEGLFSENNESEVNEGESYGYVEEQNLEESFNEGQECDMPEEEGDVDGKNEREEGQEGSELNTENDTEEEGSEEEKDDDIGDIDDGSFLEDVIANSGEVLQPKLQACIYKQTNPNKMKILTLREKGYDILRYTTKGGKSLEYTITDDEE